ncbi:unnamed protein product [Hymenolepis diminuta]|uniref:Protein SMG9 n=1 Tax=Hymenolepis diminuta TaxID=6216 RepID=A0A564Z6Z5_HYMDI|nr:unnamed protein product [Hymenolepis diminuta]
MGKKSKSRKPSSIRDLFTEEIKPNLPVGAGKANKEVKRVCEEPMHNPLKLVDENFEFKYTDRLRSFFKSNTGFLVVGIIGRKGVGKSTVANLVANAIEDEPNLETPFPVQTVDTLVSCYSQTQIGVDVLITHDRVIILDTQPLLDWTAADVFCKGGLCDVKTKANYASSGELSEASETSDRGPSRLMKNWSLETVAEIVSLQLVSFLASVCHVVVCVQDNLSDPTLLRLIDRGFGWKPLVLVNEISLAHKPRNMTAHILKPGDGKVMEGGDKEGIEEDEEEIIDVNEAPSSDTKDLGQNRPDEFAKELPPHEMENPSSDTGVPIQTKYQASNVANEQTEVQNYVNKLQSLTDYSASLLHVYNCAPVEVFINPRKSEKRLKEYKRLLTRMFPMRLELESFVNVGPKVLKGSSQNCRKVSGEQSRSFTLLDDEDEESDVSEDGDDQQEKNRADSEKDAYAKRYESDSNFNPKKYSDVEVVVDRSKEENTLDDLNVGANEDYFELPTEKQEYKTPTNRKLSDLQTLTEDEIVADCIRELSKLSFPRNARAYGKSQLFKAAFRDEKAEEEEEEEKDDLFYAGDCENIYRVAEKRNLFRKIMLDRKQQLHVSSSIATSRLFLLPAINENGEVEVGSPSYWECAYLLQEAVLSTPRRHPTLSGGTMTELQWLDFAHEIWKTLSSPETSYLFDYHRLMAQDLF